MSYNRPIIVSIAGFDPTGGAGVLADVKTIEQHQCLGFSVLTANTIQTESSFESANWIDLSLILKQLKTLFENYQIGIVKIGIVENLDVLQEIIDFIRKINTQVRIIWDPVISSSTGFNFLSEINKNKLHHILQKIYLLTPNVEEVKKLSSIENEQSAANYLSQFCALYLKGGHSAKSLGLDVLFEGNSQHKFSPGRTDFSAKHGSGCILSTAIACNLAIGKSLIEACQEAKKYVEKRLESNEKLLAYHV